MKKYFKIKEIKFIILLVVIVLGTVFFRFKLNSEKTVYVNYDATYHVLLTNKAYDRTPIFDHRFLPIVSLGEKTDKGIPWGATIPDKYGNFYYTSFPSGGFIAPYIFFKLFNLEMNVNTLFIFSSIILLVSVLGMYFLTKKISRFLKIDNPDIPAFWSSIIYIFSLETFYSHGYVYWGHSLFQPIYIIFLIFCFSLFSEEKNDKKTPLYIFILSFALCSIEWSGYLIVTSAFLVCLFFLPKRNIKKEMIALSLGGLLALVLFLSIFVFTVDIKAFFNALKMRFMARNITNSISIFELFKSYWSSYYFYLFLIPFGIYRFIKLPNNMRKSLYPYIIIISGGLLENILMKQHAISYNFDRLKFLVIFSLIVPLIWLSKKYFSKISVVIILLSSILTICKYPFERTKEDEVLLENKKVVEDIKRDCSNSILGTDKRVRGYINITLDRGIYEHVSKEDLKKLSIERKSNSYCYIEIEYDKFAFFYGVYGKLSFVKENLIDK